MRLIHLNRGDFWGDKVLKLLPSILFSTVLVLWGTSIGYAQPRMRLAEDVRVFSRGLPGMLAVTVERGWQTSLCYLDLERGRALEYPAAVSNSAFPAFSSNGESLAFVAEGKHSSEVFISRWNGEGVAPMTFNSRDEGNPSWSAQDDAIFFFSELNGYEREIYRTSVAQPLTVQRVTRLQGQSSTPVESPDGKVLAFSTDVFYPAWNVCLRNQENGKIRCPFKKVEHSNCRPHWSPDGSKIVFSMELGEEIDLYLYDLNTKQRTRLTDLPGREYDAVWSPDGEYVAFAHSEKGSGAYVIKAINVRTKIITLLAEALDGGSLRYLSWGPRQNYAVVKSDLCPSDPRKVSPGMCGCGNREEDLDEDGIPTCLDECPLDERKINPGSCGCGAVEAERCSSQPRAPLVASRRIGGAFSIVTVVAPTSGPSDVIFYLRLSRKFIRKQSSAKVMRYRTNQRGAVRAAWREIDGSQSRWSQEIHLR